MIGMSCNLSNDEERSNGRISYSLLWELMPKKVFSTRALVRQAILHKVRAANGAFEQGPLTIYTSIKSDDCKKIPDY